MTFSAEILENLRSCFIDLFFRDQFFSGGFAGTRIFPKKSKEDPQWRLSKKSEKRFRTHNSEKHQRKNKKVYIMDNVDLFNKFH